MKEKKTKRIKSGRIGSALIMTIVLTVLLSIVALMFVAVARMDKAATSNIADNKMLESAAKSIVELINRELVLDTPGVAGQEYYDYPDANNAWLASLQPYRHDAINYIWHQISDVTGFLKNHGYQCHDVNVQPYNIAYNPDVIRDYPQIKVYSGGTPQDQSADADGDGIADSKWIELKDIRSSKGKPIYAAVRVIDNGGMINVNTAHSFDANSADGSSQMQVNLKGLLKTGDDINDLHQARCGSEVPTDWAKYKKDVIWDYNSIPGGNYLPFDISDELELRYRYCINSKFKSRFEVKDPCTAKTYGKPGSLYDASSDWGLSDWKNRITEPNKVDRRHLLTNCSLDRVINPSGGKMTNINDANLNILYSTIRSILPDANMAAQIAVNIIDYRDIDSDVCDINVGNVIYYGFERPCIYISELAFSFAPPDTNIPGDPNHRSYAIELYKPYRDKDFNDWQVRISGGGTVDINGIWSGDQFYVIGWQDPVAPLPILWIPNDDRGNPAGETKIFDTCDIIYLERKVNSNWIEVDRVPVPPLLVNESNGTPVTRAYQRDISSGKCIRRLWGVWGMWDPNLGYGNKFTIADPNTIQAHPANGPFRNIGEIGRIFLKNAYGSDGIGYDPAYDQEREVLVNLADPNFQQIFKYLTVIDPYNFHPADPCYVNATKVKGRININTAPAFVVAQLPWVSHRKGGYNDANLAKAIVVYRDRTVVTGGDPNYRNRVGAAGIESIGELCNVTRGSDPNYGIDYYSRDNKDQNDFPDLDEPSNRDRVADDFEERDLIFARISDLVTVRSDVFTAYILVRIGTDGPQKRYMVILDRSGVNSSGDKVKIRAFQTVPEAR